MSSESLLGLNEPIDYMCPQIDGYVKQSKDLVSDVNNLYQCECIEDVRSVYKDLDWYVGDFEGYFEECRGACDDLREWGKSWKLIAKELMNEHYPEWEDEDSEDYQKVTYLLEGLF